MLERIKEMIGAETKLLEKENTSAFCIRSNKMYQDLGALGIHERKSKTVSFPTNISANMVRHVIRGIFDGDGTVYWSGNYLHFGFYGNHFLLEQIKHILAEEFNISNNKIFDKSNVSLLYFSKKKDIKNFYDYIYKDASIFLTRKKKRFDIYLSTN